MCLKCEINAITHTHRERERGGGEREGEGEGGDSLYFTISPCMESRSPGKCCAISPSKSVPCFHFCICFLHLPPLCMFYLISNSTVSLLWISMHNYLRLGCGHSCPGRAHKRKKTEGAGLKQNTSSLIEWVLLDSYHYSNKSLKES